MDEIAVLVLMCFVVVLLLIFCVSIIFLIREWQRQKEQKEEFRAFRDKMLDDISYCNSIIEQLVNNLEVEEVHIENLQADERKFPKEGKQND